MANKFRGEKNRSQAVHPATPGRYYVVRGDGKGPEKDDSLSRIAAIAYGNGKKWREIWRANKKIARKTLNKETGKMWKNPNFSFWPGDVIWIPGTPPPEELREEVAATLDDAPEVSFILILDGKQIDITRGSAVVAADTAADGWSVTVAFDPQNEEQRRLYLPYAYHSAQIYLSGDLTINGFCYVTNSGIKISTGRELGLEGWSLTADVIDSSVSPPYERNNVTLENLAKDLVEPSNIQVQYDVFKEGTTEKDDRAFKRVTADEGQGRIDHLASIAKQRGVQVSCTPDGNLLLHKPKTKQEPVFYILEGFPPFGDITAKYDGRLRFNSMTVTAKGPGKRTKTSTANDSAVPQSRFKTISANDVESGELEKTAKAELSKSFREAMSFEIPVVGWNIPGTKDRWKPNTIVNVISDTLFIRNGFDFYVSTVEYIKEAGRREAILTLVPPQVYNGEEIPDMWS